MDGQSRSKNISFSLSGCGFLGIYHIGVASCLQRHVPQIVQEANFAGASAGAMIACCVICEVPLDQCVDFTLRLAHKTRMSALGAFNPSLNVTEILRGALDEVLPPDAHVRCTDRLFVSITELPLLTNRIISKFHSRDHLIHVLLMSAFVPGFSGYFNLPYENGKICIDGGFSVNIPILNNKTIVVSPFSGESDICPSDFDVANIVTIDLSCTSMKVSVANFCRIFDALFPPPSEQLKEMCWQGYSDAMQYLIDHKMICCPEHMMYVNLMHNAPHHHGSCEECQQTVVSAELDTYLPKAIIHILDIYHWKESSIAYRIFSSYAYKAIVIITKPWLFCVNGWFRAAYTTMTMVPFMPKSLLDRVGDMTRNLTAEAVLLMMEKAVKFLMKASLYRATDWVYSKCSAHLAVQLTVEHCEDEKILAQDLHVAGKDKDKQMEAVKDKHYASVLTDNRASHLQVMEPETDPCVGHAKAPEDAHDQVCLAVPPVVVGDIETDTSSGATSISVLRSDQDIQFGLKVNFKTQVEPRDGAYETESTVEALEDVCIESLVLEPPEATSPASIVEKVELSLPAPLNDEQQKTPLDVKELCPESLDTMQACVEAFQEMELIMILHYLDKNHKCMLRLFMAQLAVLLLPLLPQLHGIHVLKKNQFILRIPLLKNQLTMKQKQSTSSRKS
ncbi:uncharacterized protein LOC112559422 isoform X1 [Pomacea canaliculata]|uniref:uncharacterized protein LOC112559422 isoform X1 n=1 Tax=Pomacea canaliculata TaxID=400727 RepID=UPI000D734A36|nr:uncharacterized protein LOC112559422 isoform X1 [Pomacea canaliculata]